LEGGASTDTISAGSELILNPNINPKKRKACSESNCDDDDNNDDDDDDDDDGDDDNDDNDGDDDDISNSDHNKFKRKIFRQNIWTSLSNYQKKNKKKRNLY
jgi:hypothetical protein